MACRNYQGHTGHNSSRVLAPPGGKSSIFFGSQDAAPAPVKTYAPRAAPQAPVEPLKPFNTNTQAAPINPHAVPAAAPATAPSHGHVASSATMFGSHDTLVSEGKHRDVRTSSRVLNPPGGRCHNIFG
eukprot:m.351608 g.351608  ORF g.351608 m.351608 type:complete len:128 (+) comp16292_c0_seq1:238-621(+)